MPCLTDFEGSSSLESALDDKRSNYSDQRFRHRLSFTLSHDHLQLVLFNHRLVDQGSHGPLTDHKQVDTLTQLVYLYASSSQVIAVVMRTAPGNGLC